MKNKTVSGKCDGVKSCKEWPSVEWHQVLFLERIYIVKFSTAGFSFLRFPSLTWSACIFEFGHLYPRVRVGVWLIERVEDVDVDVSPWRWVQCGTVLRMCANRTASSSCQYWLLLLDACWASSCDPNTSLNRWVLVFHTSYTLCTNNTLSQMHLKRKQLILIVCDFNV